MDESRAVSASSIATKEDPDQPVERDQQQQTPNILGGNGEAAITGGVHEGHTGGISKTLNMTEGQNSGVKGSLWRIFQYRCSETITHEESTFPLAWQALLTGMVDALIYARSSIWTGFQTGNMVQFSQNIAQYILPQAEKNPLLTLERALSVTSFFLGSFIGAKGGIIWGDKKRGWQASSAVIQSIFLFGASAILLSRPEGELPTFQYWPGVIIMTAFSMGMQSIAAQKLISPAFATTVAFTATLTQIASDPYLFALSLTPVDKHINKKLEKSQRQGERLEEAKDRTEGIPRPLKTLGRDRRVLGIVALCTGAGIAECIIYSSIGLRGGLTIAAGFKLIQAFLWFAIPRGQRV